MFVRELLLRLHGLRNLLLLFLFLPLASLFQQLLALGHFARFVSRGDIERPLQTAPWQQDGSEQQDEQQTHGSSEASGDESLAWRRARPAQAMGDKLTL
jgi:hypothetical protein